MSATDATRTPGPGTSRYFRLTSLLIVTCEEAYLGVFLELKYNSDELKIIPRGGLSTQMCSTHCQSDRGRRIYKVCESPP